MFQKMPLIAHSLDSFFVMTGIICMFGDCTDRLTGNVDYVSPCTLGIVRGSCDGLIIRNCHGLNHVIY